MDQPRSSSSQTVRLQLAGSADARQIGIMSRDLIEMGLPWSWRPARVRRQVQDRDTVVLTARSGPHLVGFAIMRFFEHTAHLNLLSVRKPYQRNGIGRRLVLWLEESARVAGIFRVSVEVRADNQGARAFYRALGYEDTAFMPLYYAGREAAIRMVHDLRVTASS